MKTKVLEIIISNGDFFLNYIFIYIYYYFIISFLLQSNHKGGWGIGDWGLGIGPNPQSPLPKNKYFFN